MNLAQILSNSARRFGDRVAVKLNDAEVTYGQLEGASALAAGWLRDLGIGTGDAVGYMMPNLPQVHVLYFGILRRGGVVLPVNPLFKGREIAYALADSNAKALFAWEGVAEEAAKGAAEAGIPLIVVSPASFAAQAAEHAPEPMTERSDEDTAVLLYTSGTTGRSKGAELSHANMRRNAEVSTQLFSLSEQDVIFGGLPLFHSFGQTCGMNAAILAGATLTMIPRFDAGTALQVLQRDRVTIMEGVPTMYMALLNHPDHADFDVSSLRLAASGGSALPVEVLRGFEAEFGCILVEGYGLSETSPVASFNHPDRERKAGSIGTPIAGVEFELVDPAWQPVPEGEIGEIAIRGHNVMKGYLNRPEETAAVMRDGWLRTGDLATRDSDGYYFIVDRAKDMIIRGGYNVYPREVEEVLYSHPAVAEAAVKGVPHPLHGEEIVAAVALKPGAVATPDELQAFVKEQVAPYKYPRHVWLVDALPKGPTGKILKREITPPEAIVTPLD